MCVPAAAAIPLAMAAGGVQAISQVYGGLSANASSRYAAAVAQQNRSQELLNRGVAIERGKQEQTQHWRKVAASYGNQVAAQAASGLDAGFGSPAALTGDIMMLGYEDAATIDRNVLEEVRGYEINAANYLMQGRAARSRGRGALVGSVLGAAGTILGSAAQVGQMKMPPSSGRGF